MEIVTVPWAGSVRDLKDAEWYLGQGNRFSLVESRSTTGIQGGRRCFLEGMVREDSSLLLQTPWGHCHIAELRSA